jgi:hypothetical protein
MLSIQRTRAVGVKQGLSHTLADLAPVKRDRECTPPNCREG